MRQRRRSARFEPYGTAPGAGHSEPQQQLPASAPATAPVSRRGSLKKPMPAEDADDGEDKSLIANVVHKAVVEVLRPYESAFGPSPSSSHADPAETAGLPPQSEPLRPAVSVPGEALEVAVPGDVFTAPGTAEAAGTEDAAISSRAFDAAAATMAAGPSGSPGSSERQGWLTGATAGILEQANEAAAMGATQAQESKLAIPATALPPSARRVSFGNAVRTLVEEDSACQLSTAEEPLRQSDCGRYYPASALQQAHGDEYAKAWPRAREEPQCFCSCTDGCRSPECPCTLDGVGCWFEGWGCACHGACLSSIPPHVFNDRMIKRARLRMLSKMRSARRRTTL